MCVYVLFMNAFISTFIHSSINVLNVPLSVQG